MRALPSIACAARRGLAAALERVAGRGMAAAVERVAGSAVAAAIAASVAGCGSRSRGIAPDALPQIPDSTGVAVLAHPAVVTVTFAGDPLAGAIEAWADWAVASSWLAAVGADYGVGAGTQAAKVRLPDAAPSTASNDDIAALLANAIAAGTVPAPTPGVVYMMYFPAPPATDLTSTGQTYCTDYSGYHSNTNIGGADVSFAAVGRCQAFWPGLTELQAVERTASHELIEAATDPFPYTTLGYYLPQPGQGAWTPGTSAWGAAGETEVGDLCTGTQVVVDGDFVAQRTWSNRAAASGADPCVPSPDAAVTYDVASAAPWFPVAIGGTVSIPLEGWAVGEMASNDWVVSAVLGSQDAGFAYAIESPTSVTLQVADGGASTGQAFSTTRNGASLELRVTAPASASPGDYAAFRVLSRTRDQVVAPDAIAGDWYHHVAVGAYVPPAP